MPVGVENVSEDGLSLVAAAIRLAVLVGCFAAGWWTSVHFECDCSMSGLNPWNYWAMLRAIGDSPWAGADLQSMVRDSKRELLAVTALSAGTAVAYTVGGPAAAMQACLCLLKVQGACPAGAQQHVQAPRCTNRKWRRALEGELARRVALQQRAGIANGGSMLVPLNEPLVVD